MGARAEPAAEARVHRRVRALLVLLALVPSLGTLKAPWIAEDTSILARVAADGPMADWLRPQYGMQLLRFWRPLVSASWWLGEAATGVAPAPLRMFNLGLHVAVVLGVFALALRLGARTRGALLAGAWVALFPEQGGVCTWLAGRTDLLCAAFLVWSAWASFGRAPRLAAALAFLGCASKEFGFLAAPWVALLALGGGVGLADALRRALPAALGTGAALVLRSVALGGLAGGYAVHYPPLASGLLGSARALLGAWPGALLLVPVLVAVLLPAREARCARLAAFAAGLALVPLYPLLCDGYLEPENQRLYYVPGCALALAFGLGLGAPGALRLRGPALALAGLALVVQAGFAWSDTHDWARAAYAAAEAEARARAALVGAEEAPRPVLFRGFERSHAGAYCLGFGVAERFRAPFARAPRPVWPWRLAFLERDEAQREPRVAARADGSIWPLDDALRVPVLALTDTEGVALEALTLDERVLPSEPDLSARLRLAGAPPGVRLEALLVTELGYEPFPLGEIDASGRAELTCMRLMGATNGVVAVGEFLAQVADLGATRAYLELRATGPAGELLAAAPWIELGWTPELVAAALSAP